MTPPKTRIRPAQRLDNLPPYPFAVLGASVARLEAEGKDIIKLHAGNPDMPPPDHVVEAMIASAKDPTHHGYAGYSGTPGLRKAVADYYQDRYGVSLDPSREVLPLIGSKEGLAHFSMAYLDPGDIALVPDPAYPTYEMATILAGAEAYAYPLLADNRYLPDLSGIPADILERARILWISYPNNPTGAAASLDDLARLVEFASAHGLALASDSPYMEITFEGQRAPSVLEVDGAKEVAIEFNSLSKTYNMAGWRIGMAVGGAPLIEGLLAVKSNVDTGLFRAACDAGEAALRDTPRSWIEARNDIYRARRDRMMAALPDLGLRAETPQAAIYIWAKVADGDDVAFAQGALEEAGVSMAPGRFYGKMGEGYVRISLTTPDERQDEAIERLKVWRAG